MATHSSVLAWRIPGTGELGGLPSMELHRVEHNWSNLAAAAAGGRQVWNDELLLNWKENWDRGRLRPITVNESWLAGRSRLIIFSGWGTFPQPVLSYFIPRKGRGYQVPWAYVWRGKVGSGGGGPAANVPTGHSFPAKCLRKAHCGLAGTDWEVLSWWQGQ